MPTAGPRLRGTGMTLTFIQIEVVHDEGTTFDPALRTADFFETLYSGKADENFLTEFAAEIRFT